MSRDLTGKKHERRSCHDDHETYETYETCKILEWFHRWPEVFHLNA